ncbi:MAG: hypothetical protein R2839_07670 [Thermomicrobiales bacterium]
MSAVVTMSGSIASAVGSSFLAPVIIKYSTMKTIFDCGWRDLSLFGAIRTLKLPSTEKTLGVVDVMKNVEWKPEALIRWTASWIVEHRPVATMILSGNGRWGCSAFGVLDP